MAAAVGDAAAARRLAQCATTGVRLSPLYPRTCGSLVCAVDRRRRCYSARRGVALTAYSVAGAGLPILPRSGHQPRVTPIGVRQQERPAASRGCIRRTAVASIAVRSRAGLRLGDISMPATCGPRASDARDSDRRGRSPALLLWPSGRPLTTRLFATLAIVRATGPHSSWSRRGFAGGWGGIDSPAVMWCRSRVAGFGSP